MRAAFFALALSLAVSATPLRRDLALQNGQAAIAQNNQFKTLTPDSPCTTGTDACVDQKFAQCVNGKFVIQACAATTICVALPLVNAPGTTIACTTEADFEARIAATGATDPSAGQASASSVSTTSAAAATTTAVNGTDNQTSGNPAGNDDSDPQTSLTLDPRVIAKGFENDGQDVPTEGQIPSLISNNNFINFCLTVPDLPLTNGQQLVNGSCNPAPIGVIPNVNSMPSSKFVFPKNTDVVPSNQSFNIQMALNNLEAGNFVNAKENYFAAPQTLNDQGLIIGHTHVVIEALSSIDQTSPTNPTKFVFFKGINDAQVNGIVTANVTAGVPPGAYRLCSINSSANHQPVIVPIAQHGSLDDCVYFTSQ